MTTLHRSSSDGIGIDTKDTDVDLVPAALKRAAEAEMRRSLPSHLPSHDQRPLKKQKSAQDYVHLPRYDYSAAQDLESGGVVGFIASCAFRRYVTCLIESLLAKPKIHIVFFCFDGKNDKRNDDLAEKNQRLEKPFSS